MNPSTKSLKYSKRESQTCQERNPQNTSQNLGGLVSEPLSLSEPFGQTLPWINSAAKMFGDVFAAYHALEDAPTVKAIRSPQPHAKFGFGSLAAFAQLPGAAAIFTAGYIIQGYRVWKSAP